ncbi:excinuclease ABC subunit UvrC [Canibacter sp. lx-72]|uniref:excinuclease ABC subunit UvrC n=1 Tax=Canibacter zhuwentaonis TaxID=2837491 RepID=UPI001BDC8C8F|nr:excinuclease ABC subunit UvrC [Canibacter zhuwentaonis]MBT1018491.1 excinuclease ABC subunit UvrC [Canibacter zhuwentaonis]MBT1035668.1 excinuclease ABC subunit UvrC [Canibacter zhuwentaonis]
MQDNREKFKPAPGEVPGSPGVYRFADSIGRVLYIGKAKNLRSRLANYFQPYQRLAPRTQQMLSRAATLSWTVVASDTEALVLEQDWIRRQQPRYNVLFRDDKTFPYLVVTLGSKAPRLIITRNPRIKGAKYYGPYPKAGPLKETVNLINQAFTVRTCNDSEYNRAMRSGKPCFAGQIGRCHGPCSMLVSWQEHDAAVADMVRFLNRLDTVKIHEIEREMRAAAEVQDYAKATVLRNQIRALNLIIERNNIVFRADTNADFFGIYADELVAVVHHFIVINGRLRGEKSWRVDIGLEATKEELLQQAVQTAYDANNPPPPEILVSENIPDLESVSQVLSQLRPRGGRVAIQKPLRGEKAQLMQTAVRNAGEMLIRYKLKRTNDLISRTESLAQLQEALALPEPPLRIECVDVSHLQGTEVVASLVVFEDGLPVKSAYRRYKLEDHNDDVDSIYQVISRRAAALSKPDAPARERPQMFLIDGAAPQAQAARAALAAHGITDIAVCGIAKRLEELWLPGSEFPVILSRNSEVLFLVQRIRDEAHRFAITFHRARRAAAITSDLATLQGVGKVRMQKLLRHFGSSKRVRAASAAEIAAVDGVGETLAAQIYEQLHGDIAPDPV